METTGEKPDTSMKNIATNLGNWYQRNVLENKREDIVRANPTPTNLGNWYERNVLRNARQGASAVAPLSSESQ